MDNWESGDSGQNSPFYPQEPHRLFHGVFSVPAGNIGLFPLFQPPTDTTTEININILSLPVERETHTQTERINAMRFAMEAQTLNEAIVSVIKALPVRAAMPVLDGIYICADANGVRMKCSDLMLQKECVVPAAVDEPGECVVKGKIFCEIARKLPSENVFASLDGNTLTLRCGRSINQLQCMEYDEFPDMHFEEADSTEVKVDKNRCKELILRTAFAVSTEESRPVLTGVYMEMEGHSLSMVATDSFQFAKNTMTVSQDLPKKSMIVPGKTIQEIARMLDESQEETVLTFSRTHMRVKAGGAALVGRLLDGDYIDYRRLIPRDCKSRVLVDREAFLESVDRAALVAREGNNSVRLSLQPEKLFIRAESVIGKVEEELPVQLMGDSMDIAFNPKYLLNVFKTMDDEKVYMEMNTPINPCAVKPVTGEAFFYLVVPMRIF